MTDAPGQPAGGPYDAPPRIRAARLIFAFAALAALIGMALILTLHPAVTAENDAVANQVLGALVALNMQVWRYLYGPSSPPARRS